MASRGGGGGGGGRVRPRRDYPSSRFEDSNSSSRKGKNPPSRHLWVGNLPHSLIEAELRHVFLRFGELESVAFQAGRSYAFVNFLMEEEAIAAMKALQGFSLAGNPLKIEFAKADKSSTPSHDEDYLQRQDEQRSSFRGSPYSQRESRLRSRSPETSYPEKFKSDKGAEPSEVLWIGFPSLLKVDETILRKAFSPFGEIEKISVFPGRSYAFVRFRSVTSACRAKETLQGKLFGNPRVHICFAKNETGTSSSGRNPLSPHSKSSGRSRISESYRPDRNFGSMTTDPGIRSPHFTEDLDPGDSDVYGFSRKETFYPGESNMFDNWRFAEELGPPPDVYERRGTPTRDGGSHFHEFDQKFPQSGPLYEEPWDFPEDSFLFHGAKRLKTGSFPPDQELPEYPYSDRELEKHAFPRALSDFPQSEVFDKSFEAGPLGYKPVQDRPINFSLPHGERSDHWNSSYDNLQVRPTSLSSSFAERKRFTPEPERPSLNLWKWEGTIAKGGTLVCRAHGFPVGKKLDMMLPEFLDCTARTSLDMLAKHYFQAASAWVVFFAPASDADIGYYHEFMHYLGEKQRAAVAKLDDKTTLFLVPPSDFSEKVLKVPGKLSISGVVLRLEHPSSNTGSLHHTNEKRETNLHSFHGDPTYPKSSTPPGHYPAMSSYPDLGKSGGDPSFYGNVPPVEFSGPSRAAGRTSDSYEDDRHDYQSQKQNPILDPNWSPHHSQRILGSRSFTQEHHLIMPREENGPTRHVSGRSSDLFSGNNKQALHEAKPSVPLSLPIAGLQPQQLAQLASSLLGQQRHSGSNLNVSMGEDYRHPSDNEFRAAHKHGLQNNQAGFENPSSQPDQFPQMQLQQTSKLSTALAPSQGNPQLSTGNHDDADGDPQKRLQATLQLAAALLQQIQQGKGT